MRFIADFNAQTWFNNSALSVDPCGDTTWDVTEHVGMLRPDLRPRLLLPSLERDGLREASTTPAWIKKWSGPFEIELHVELDEGEERAGADADEDLAVHLAALPYSEPHAVDAIGNPLIAELRDLLDRGLDVSDARLVLEALALGDEPAPAPSYVVVQEGGSSSEIYISAHESREDAEAFRINCRDDGAYRTSGVFEVPSELASHGEALYELLEQVSRVEFDFPECDAVESLEDVEA